MMRAIIIGAGPAGLAAAIRLKTALNWDVAVYEIRSKPTTIGGAVQLPPNGLRLMDQLGLSERLNQRGFRSSRMHTHSMQGQLISDIDRAETAGDASGYGYMRIMRKDLVDVLGEAAREQGIPIHFGKRLSRIEEGSLEVTAFFEDETSDSGDIVLGCDGIHSVVRRLHVDPDAVPIYSGISNLLAVLPVSSLEAENRNIAPALHGIMTPKGVIALTPCDAKADYLYWFFSRGITIPEGDSREGWEAKGKEEVDAFKDNLLDALQDAQGTWVETLRDVIRKSDTIKFYPIFKMSQECKWSSQRCLLLGDAAHAMQPHVGQGTSMALEDVFWLSRLLEDPRRSLADAFTHFERVRRPRVEAMSQAAANNGKARVQITTTTTPPGQEKGTPADSSMPGLRGPGVGEQISAVAYNIMEEALPVVA